MNRDRNNDLTLTVDGKAFTGWTGVSVTLSIEQMPNTFVIEATEKSPVVKDAVRIKEGSPCTVSLGGDKVVTGYVDTVAPYFQPGAHGVRLMGRGKCQDLVDCAAQWKGFQISGSNALEIATKLAKPYGITARALTHVGPVVPQFNMNVTDTTADVLELVTRQAGLLYYEDPNGNLVLSEVAAEDAASGFVEGQNVQSASLVKSVAQRYSTYTCAYLSTDTSGLFEERDGLFFFESDDPYVGRHRPLVIVAEGVGNSIEFAKTRALWEASRRAGRGRAINITVDSWRDAAGKLWTPNTLAPLSLPSLLADQHDVTSWCISTVTFKQDLEGGTTADVMLMPYESFLPAPIVLQPTVAGLT